MISLESRFEKLSVNSKLKRDELAASDCLFPAKRVQQLMTFRYEGIGVGVGLYNAGKLNQ